MQSTTALRRTLLAGAIAAAGIGIAAGPAGAMRPAGEGGPAYATGKVDVNDGYTLSVRSAPRANAPVLRKLKDGATVKIKCQTVGDPMTGRFGSSRIWDKLKKGGYVTDTFVYTGSDDRVAGDCGGSAPTTPPTTGTSTGRPKSITLKDDYPYRTGNPDLPEKWGFYQRECTSFVASRISRVVPGFSNRMRGGHFGDAGNWDDNARALGYRVDTTPKPGSVMVRNSGTYGHVAMVAKTAPGKIFVEQYNAGGTHVYSKQWLSTAGMVFIHFKKGQ